MTRTQNAHASIVYAPGTPVFVAQESLDTECGVIKGKVLSVGRKLMHIEVPDATYTAKQNAEGLKNTFKKISLPIAPAPFTMNEARAYFLSIANKETLSLPNYIVYGLSDNAVRLRYDLITKARKEMRKGTMNPADILRENLAQSEEDRLRQVIDLAHAALSGGRVDEAYTILKAEVG